MSQTMSTNVEELRKSLFDSERFPSTNLTGYGPYPLEQFHRLQGTARIQFDLKSLFTHSCCLSKTLESEEVKLLREFTSTDPSLRSVDLAWRDHIYRKPCSPGCKAEPFDDILAAGWRCIMPAIAANRSIVRLRLPSPLWCSEDVFCDLLRQTRSLQILEMTVYNEDKADVQMQIADAFGANATLKYIALFADEHWGNIGQFITAILKQLVHHPRLQYLELSCNHCNRVDAMQHMAILCILLKTTTTLQSLVLSGYVFGTSTMELLVEGLQSNRTVTKLVLESSRYNITEESSGDVFMNFLSRSDLECPLRILEYDGCADRLGKAMFPAASRQETSQLPMTTIASKLEVLKLSVPTVESPPSDISYGGFLDVLMDRANAKVSRLRELSVRVADSSSCAALAAGLFELVHLRKFSLPIVVNGKFDWKRWLHAVHRSGSLQSIENTWRLDYPCRPLLFRRLEARNKMLPIVLKKICGLQHADEMSRDATTSAGDTRVEDMSLIPTLLCVTKPMYRWGPTYGLMCLLAINNSEMDIDPFRRPKRLCVGMK